MRSHTFKSSSAIASLDYDEDREVLVVTFTNGSSYTFEGVDQSTVDAFASSDSPGRFFNANLRGMY